MFLLVSEILNSLFICSALTEILHSHTHGENKKWHEQLYFHSIRFISWILINALFHYISSVKSVVISVLKLVAVILSPIAAICEILGSTIMIFVCVASLFVAHRYLSSPIPHSLGNWNDLYAVVGTSVSFLSVKLLGFDNFVNHTETMKIVVLTACFVILLYLDLKRHIRGLTLTAFYSAILNAVAFSILAIPIAAIGISFCFLLLVSFLQKIGFDAENSSLVNNVVFYGVLYGPFYIIYWHAKDSMLRTRFQLPT